MRGGPDARRPREPEREGCEARRGKGDRDSGLRGNPAGRPENLLSVSRHSLEHLLEVEPHVPDTRV